MLQESAKGAVKLCCNEKPLRKNLKGKRVTVAFVLSSKFEIDEPLVTRYLQFNGTKAKIFRQKRANSNCHQGVGIA